MKKTLKKVLGLGLCLCMAMSVMAVNAEETENYTAYPQGTLENVAQGKKVLVSNSTSYFEVRGNTSYVRTGKYLTDGRNDTYWESNTRLGEYVAGEWAMIDLGVPYEIHKLELIGNAANETGRKNYAVYGTNTYDFLHGTLEGVPAHYELLMERGDTAFDASVSDSVILKGQTYRYIILKKTAAEVARFSELRVYGVEPKTFEVTPTDASGIWTNAAEYLPYYPVTNMINKTRGDFAFYQGGRVTLDLGDEYYVRKVDVAARNDEVFGNNNDFVSRRNFAVYTGNASSISDDITSGGGTTVGSIGTEVGMIMLPDETTNANSYQGQYAAGGQTLTFEQNPTEETRYVTLKSSEGGYVSFSELIVWAEDRTSEEIVITNVAKDVTPVKGSGTYQLDLGDYYNVKKVEIVPASGASVSNFRVVGTTTAELGRDELPLAASKGAISTETEYDVKLHNMVQYVTLQADDISGVAEIKVWAEKDVKYTNFALGKTAGAPAGGAALTNGSFGDIGYGDLDAGPTSGPGAALMYIDLGTAKKIESYMVMARSGWDPAANERNAFQVWGANKADFSDATLLDRKDGRPFMGGGAGYTKAVNSNEKYRYVIFTGLYDQANVNFTGALFHGTYSQTHEANRQKVWNEIMIFTEVSDAVDVVYEEGPGFFDNDISAFGDLDEIEVELDRYYPINLVSITPETATTADITVYGKNAAADGWTELGTIAAGATELELDGTAYKFIKLAAASTQYISEIDICTPKKYYNKDIVTDSFMFNNSTDGTGAEIADLTASVLGAKATVTNLTGEPKSAVLIVGLYDENNILVDVAVSESKTVTYGTPATLATGIIPESTPAAGSTLKAFVWESVTKLNPYSPSEILE